MVLSASFGSYPRPEALREYQVKTYGKQKKTDHKPTDKDVQMLIRAMRQVVEDQTGLDIITDGQLTWDDFLASVAAGFGGVEMGGLIRFYDNNTYYRRPIIVGEITNDRPTLTNTLALLKDLNPGAKIKAVVPGPYSLYDLSEDRYYHDKAKAIEAFATALLTEVRALDADYIQIDEPSLSYSPDRELFPVIKAQLERLVRAAKGKTIIATYFGNLRTCIKEITELKADYIGVDCISFQDNYEILAESGIKNVQLGILDARNTKLEDRTEVRNRIDMLGSDNIIISTNCGLEFLPREYALRKVDLLSRLANE